jgi:Uma2 family endonuclease
MIEITKLDGLHSPAGVYRFNDLFWIGGPDCKADLINGVAYLASPCSLDENRIYLWLLTVLHGFVHEKDLGRTFGCRVAFRLNSRNGPEPDLAFVGKSRQKCIKSSFVKGPPDFALEIVSPDSILRDYQFKRELYELAGVKEYWIVDQLKQRVTALRLGHQGKFRAIRTVNGCLRSQVIEGFRLQTTWLWKKPLPSELKTLESILKT